ncbi:MAG: protein phosphatase 2C domain-containing protein [Clostridia bacterium]|jgi:hypothetical protein|nr:protein phosphatase 2C domain-containing protein [Clostridia bacterium]
MSITTIFEKGKIGNFDYKVIGLSMTGLSHVKNEIENQDSFGFHKNSNGVLIAVADGVGSCVKSKAGSIYAIETIKTLYDIIENGEIRVYANTKIKKFIISKWKSKLEGPIRDYSTTLKFAIISISNILLGGIGDGEIFATIDNVDYSLQNNVEFFSNITYSLTDDIDEDKFEIIKVDLPTDFKVLNIFIGTDGITCELQSSKKIEFLNYLSKKVRNNEDNYEVDIINWTSSLQEKNGDDKTMILFTMERST